MRSYLFIESRDPFGSRDVDDVYRLITDLAAGGTPVMLFLVQNGVLAARQEAVAGERGAAAMACPPRLDRDLWQAREAGIH